MFKVETDRIFRGGCVFDRTQSPSEKKMFLVFQSFMIISLTVLTGLNFFVFHLIGSDSFSNGFFQLSAQQNSSKPRCEI